MAKKTSPQATSMAAPQYDGFIPDDEDGFVEDPPQQSAPSWLLQNVAKPAIATPLDMITGAAQGGIDLANLIPGIHMSPALDLAQSAGVGGNRGDDLIKNLSSYIPTAAASEFAAPMASARAMSPLLAKLATEGGVYQASQTPNDPGKIALSAGINSGIPGSAFGLNHLLEKGAEYFAAPGIAKNIVSPIMDLKDLKNSDAFDIVNGNYTKHENIEDLTWDNVYKSAKKYDDAISKYNANKKEINPDDVIKLDISTAPKNPSLDFIPNNPRIGSLNESDFESPALIEYHKNIAPYQENSVGPYNPIFDTSTQSRQLQTTPKDYIDASFIDIPPKSPSEYPSPDILDTSKYVNPIKNKIQQYENLSKKHTGFKNEYGAAIENLNNYLNDSYSNFTDAINQNIALNKEYKSTVRPNTGMIKSKTELEATNFARQKLHEMIQDNLDKYGLSDTFGNDWSQARNLTKDNANIFETAPDSKGNPKISDFYAQRLTKNPYSDPTRFLNQYLPKGEGTESMEQFSAMVGNKDKATDYLKSNIFHDAMVGNKPDISKFVDITEKNLSPDQLNYLFNPQQQEQIKLLSKLNDSYPTQIPGAWKSIATGAVAGLVGFAAHPMLAIAGAGGPAAYNLAYRAASMPAARRNIQNAMLARMRGGSPIMGQTPVNASRSLIAANQSGGNQ